MLARLRGSIIYAACALALLPAAATASGGGGAGLGLRGEPVGPTGTTSTPAARGTSPVSASGDGITLRTTASAMLRHDLTFSGTARGAADQTVVIERSGRQTRWRWTPTVQATVGADGRFSATWSADHIGRFTIRAVVGAAASVRRVRARARGAAAPDATSSLTVTVFLATRATLYGPGFYGRRTACGGRLTPATIGVANRTLHCGEKVALLYDGRILMVPVVDRGPYANGADWDLTMATGRALGMTGTEEIGAVSLPVHPGS